MKIKDALSSVLGSAVRFQMLVRNPIEGIQIPLPRTGKRTKPHITPEQFELLVNAMAEPYATMVCVCVMSGLRVSELIGLKWDEVHFDSLMIDERYCRGDWGCPKTSASNAPVGVDPGVIARIHRLKDTEVTINWGGKGAKRTFKLVRSNAPRDLFSILALRCANVRSQHSVTSHQAGCEDIGAALGELASVAAVLWNLDGGIWRRSESGASADAAFAYLDDHGRLCAVRS